MKTIQKLSLSHLRNAITAAIAALTLICLNLPLVPPCSAWQEEDPQTKHYREMKEYEKTMERNKRVSDMIQQPTNTVQLWCAIAFSEKTDEYGYSTEEETEEDANRAAIKNCGHPDAQVVCSTHGNWFCALADGDTSYGGGIGSTASAAKADALSIANKSGKNNKIVLLIGGNPVVIRKWEDGETPPPAATAAPQSSSRTGNYPGSSIFPVHPTPRH